MDIQDIQKILPPYIAADTVTRIGTGKSGAEVYDIDGRYIVKYAERERIGAEQFKTYAREVWAYNELRGRADYIPEVISEEVSGDTICILMKKYEPLRWDGSRGMTEKIAQVMARIHMTDLPFPEDGTKTEMPARERIAECFDGWKSVLDEHSMDAGGARTVADRICDVIRLHDAEKDVTVHGDLHRENLLTDGERIIVCDWQAVGRGKATDDIGFFLSRAAADGINTDPREFAAMYADAVYGLRGRRPQVSDMMAGISAANVITTFFYWHLFLHGSSADIVGDVYNRMIYDLGRCVEL